MTSPINLNKVRKARAKADKRAKADENAIRFGQSKVEKERDRTTSKKADRFLDGHKRSK